MGYVADMEGKIEGETFTCFRTESDSENKRKVSIENYLRQ